MDITDILAFINNLPESVFSRNGVNLGNLMGAVVLTTASMTTGWEGYANATTALSGKSGNFLDILGAYFNIPRAFIETDATYAKKLLYALANNFGSPQAIINVLKNIYNITAEITELSPSGYSVLVSQVPSTSDLNIIVDTLKYARPAGVPFYLYSATGVPTLGSSLYLGANLNTLTTAYASNSFLGSGQTPLTYTLAANTNSAINRIPSQSYFSDPVLTGVIKA